MSTYTFNEKQPDSYIQQSFYIRLNIKRVNEIFPENTMSSFRNQLSRLVKLYGQLKSALTSISFSSNMDNVNSAEIIVVIDSGFRFDALHHTANINFEKALLGLFPCRANVSHKDDSPNLTQKV